MKVLFICTAFAPENEIGCVRTTKLAKYLVRAGHDLTVISPSIVEGMNVSNDLLCDELARIKHIHVSYSHFFLRILYSKRNSLTKSGKKTQMRKQKSGLKATMYKFAESLYTDIRNHDWYTQVKKTIKKEQLNDYDFVFSSYPSVSAHWASEYVKKTGKAKKWIADFRDPLVLESSKGIERQKLTKIQSKIVHDADLVTHVSQFGVEHFICNDEDHSKVIWIPNGYDEDDLDLSFLEKYGQRNSDNKLVFSYAGGLYAGERDCSPLFKAIRELIDEKIISLNDLQFDYAGRDYDILKNQADKFGVASVISDRGLISRDQSLEMQVQSDCVVVATFCYQDHGGAMTGKIYEPIMMEKPILMMVSGPGKNSEPGAFVEYLNAGAVYEESTDGVDVSKIKRMIIQMLAEKQATANVISGIDEIKRKQFDYKEISDRLLSAVDSL